MSATNTPAQAFALKVEAIGGWTVDRQKGHGGARRVVARHGSESFTFTWGLNANGNYAFSSGVHEIAERVNFREPWSNVAAALRIIADPGHVFYDAYEGVYFRIPFDPHVTLAEEIVELVRGREIHWRSRLTGTVQEATVPHDSKFTRVDGRNGRVLSFASYGGGFRSVDLESIIYVAGTITAPRRRTAA